MNVELFIARKILSGKDDPANISKSIITIAKFAVALSLAVMIVSVAVVTGFKSTIRSKVIGFGSHIQVMNNEINSSYEMSPIDKSLDRLRALEEVEGVKHVQQFAIKSGIIKTDDNVQGVVVKGIGSDFDWSFFSQHMVAGKPLAVGTDSSSKGVVISKKLADLLDLKLGDTFITSFIPKSTSEAIRYRVFTITGIYQTNFEEFDKKIILADISNVQKLNNWTSDQIAGYEITIDNFNHLDKVYDRVMDEVGYSFLPDGSKLKVQTIVELNPQIFDWLNLLDMNVWVILVLMVLVAGMNMISSLLVIILEKTNMIGILKSLGAKNVSVRKIFLYNAAFVVGFGILWGNLIGIGICAAQYFFKIIPLDPETYFIDFVPINMDLVPLLLLNVGTMTVTVLMLVLPSFIITKISPVNAIRFD